MQYTNLIWRDGQPYSERFDDIYYSSGEDEVVSGESEFQHVFFRHNGLPQRWSERENFVIAELGFGSGLNCILTIREWLRHCDSCAQNKILHYIAIEKYPLSADAIAELMARYPELKPFYDEVLDHYPPAVETTHVRLLFDNRVCIHFKFMDVDDALKDAQLNVDAWFLDGFSPAKNPDMWSQSLFENIAENSNAGATCSTYTAAGFVKRNLQAAGFVVNKVGGFGRKREMLVAGLSAEKSDSQEERRFNFKDKPWFEPPQKKSASLKYATVIGAGIAGLSLAYALVQRGWQVTIIDKAGDSQKQSSSNPAPIIYPRLSVDNNVDTEFFIAAYCHVLHVFNSLQKKSQKKFWFDDGLLQIMDEKRIKQIINKFDLNENFVCVDEDAEQMVTMKSGELMVNYASAGVVLPAVLCDVLKNECGEKLTIIEAEVDSINYEGNKWQCLHRFRVIDESEVLIIANGTNVNDLVKPSRFPVETIRGQVVTLNETEASRRIKKTLNADVHITPAINGKHYLGATYVKGCIRADVCQEDNRELVESLDKIYPGVFQASDYQDAWVGFRAVSKDRVPVVGAMPDEVFFKNNYADICHGNTRKTYPAAHYLPGLYVSAAHGSRGFTSSFISAEILVAQLEGSPSPVSRQVQDYLNPSRFIVNDLKRR